MMIVTKKSKEDIAMKVKKNKVKNPLKFAFLVTGVTAVALYAWMILFNIGLAVYWTQKLGSRALGKTAGAELFSHNTAIIIIAYVVMEILIVLIASLMVKKHEGKFKLDYIGMKTDKYSFKQLIYGFGIAALMFTAIYFTMITLGIISFKGYGFAGQSSLTVIGTVLLILCTTAFPGFCEEIVYRGVIQNYLMKKMNTPLALIISSLCFSITHIGRYQDLMSLFCIVVIGSVFGYIFAKTRSLYLPIGIHFAWDFFGSLFGVGKSIFNTNLILVFENAKSDEFLANLIIVIAFGLLFLALVVKYKMDESKQKEIII